MHAKGLYVCAYRRIACVCVVCVQEDYMCVHAYVHAEGCVCVCAHACMRSVCMHLPAHVVKCLSPSLPTVFFQIGSLTEAGAHHHGGHCVWSVTFRELPVSLCPFFLPPAPMSQSTNVTRHRHHLAFYSCPQICATSTFPTKLFPQFSCFVFQTGPHSPGWPQTHYVVEAGLKVLILPPLPQLLG